MKIDQNTGSEKIFALLNAVEKDLEDDIDELMNNWDTEFVFEKEYFHFLFCPFLKIEKTAPILEKTALIL